MSITIRREHPSDIVSIASVTEAAFQHAAHTCHAEHLIVDALRTAGQLTVSLVAEDDRRLVGHVAASPVTVSDGSAGWYGLGPLSVAPGRQRQGIGSLLVRQVLSELQGLGAAGCMLVGDPAYYARFGFTAEPSLVLPGVPPEVFQALSFGGSFPTGTVSFHAAFDVAEQ